MGTPTPTLAPTPTPTPKPVPTPAPTPGPISAPKLIGPGCCRPFEKGSPMVGRKGSLCPGRIIHGINACSLARNTRLVTRSPQADAAHRLIGFVVADVICTRRVQQE